MKSKTRKYLKAALPALLLCSPAVASSARTISRFKGRNIAVQSEVSDSLDQQSSENSHSDPFAVFDATEKPASDERIAAKLDILEFLQNNDLLLADGEATSKISGELGRKDFAHSSPYSHCHASGTTWNTADYPTSNATKCSTAYGGTWETGTPAPIFEDVYISAKTATSFTINVDLNKSSTVYAVLLLSTAPAPSSAQVKSGVDGSGAAAIQAKNQPVTVDPFIGTISFSGLTSTTKYMVYLVGDNGADITPTPESINPAFEYDTISAAGTWKFPKVRTDNNGDFYTMYKNSSNNIEFLKWDGSTWNYYTEINASMVDGRTSVTYGNEYRANFDFDSNNNMQVIFNACSGVMANTCDGFHGVYNTTTTTWSAITAPISDDPNPPDETRIFIDANDKVHVIYHYDYILRYATNAGGSWAAQTIVTAGQVIPPGTSSGTDEVHDGHVVVASDGTATLLYRREYGQNNREDNYFMATSTDNFVAQTLVLDGKGDAQQYQVGNVIIDGNDKIHYVYGNWTTSTGHYRTNASGSWVTTPISSSTYTITDGLDIRIDGTTTYVLTSSNSGYLFQAKDGAGSWMDGNPFSLDGWFSDKFGLDTVSNRIMLVSENSSDWTINYHTGEIGDYVLLGSPNTAPSLGGTFTTNGTVNDNVTITSLFSGVTVSDSDGDNVSVSITYTAANGTLTGSGLTGSAGNYTVSSAAPATVQANLQGLVFHPTANQVSPGNTVVTTFTLTPNDGTENGTANAATQVTATSINDAPVNTVAPAISGTNTVGNQLSANSGTWTDADGDTPTYSYQWYRADDSGGSSEAAIASATTANYTLTTTDAHKFLRVVVTADDGNGSADQTATSTRTAVANSAPVNTVVPTVSGTNTVGNQLSATSGTWTDTDGDTGLTYSYQWYRADDNSGTNETAIPLATALNYTLTTSDAHKFLRVVVTANDGNGSSDQTATSARIAIANTAPVNTAVPTISGTTTVGNQLSASSGTWTDTDGDMSIYSYQWYRADDNSGTNETAIPLATALNYTLTPSDGHKSLRVVVTANDGNGSSEQTATSTRTAIGNTAPINTVLPTINGTALIYNTLSSTTGSWTDADGDTPTYSYQWKANGIDIIGENSPTCTLTPAQGHVSITCTVTADDGNGDVTSATTIAALVDNSDPTFTGTPTITGNAKIGNTLTLADSDTSDADGDTVSLSYQWHVDGLDISGETLETYRVTSEKIDQNITCTVTADDGNGGSLSYTTVAVTVTKFPWLDIIPGLVSPNKVSGGRQ